MAKTAAQKKRAKNAVAKKSNRTNKNMKKKVSLKSSPKKKPVSKRKVTQKKAAPKIKTLQPIEITQESIENELHTHLIDLQKNVLKWVERKTKEYEKIKNSEKKASGYLSTATERKKLVSEKYKNKKTAALKKQTETAKNNWELRRDNLKQIKIEALLIKENLTQANKTKQKFSKLLQTIKKFNLDWIKSEQNKTKQKTKKKIIKKANPQKNIKESEHSRSMALESVKEGVIPEDHDNTIIMNDTQHEPSLQD